MWAYVSVLLTHIIVLGLYCFVCLALQFFGFCLGADLLNQANPITLAYVTTTLITYGLLSSESILRFSSHGSGSPEYLNSLKARKFLTPLTNIIK